MLGLIFLHTYDPPHRPILSFGAGLSHIAHVLLFFANKPLLLKVSKQLYP